MLEIENKILTNEQMPTRGFREVFPELLKT